jgi:phosphoribosylanthranilate isomerase
VKICGVTTVADAVACADLGVDAIGVNFVASSPRCVDETRAREIVRAVGSHTLVVGVVANLEVPRMRALRAATGIGCLQLHGDEDPEDVASMLPHAYKAVRIADEADVRRAEAMPGDYVLADARVQGALGGTGQTFDWRLVSGLARRRKLVLAGGLTPENVGAAIAAVDPWCVDVASGVERSTAVKDMARVRAFVEAARER